MRWEDKQLLLRLARKTLKNSFQREESPLREVIDNLSSDNPLLLPRPCFVTLFGPKESLRGCIGCTETSESLVANVFRYVQAAAFEDPRFSPVREDEIEHLKIHISVLGELFPLKTLSDLKLGVHGLAVRYRERRGLLLADVATKYGWTAEKFLKETAIKARLPVEDLPSYDFFYFNQESFGEDYSPK